MAKNVNLTENMIEWMKEMYLEAAKDELDTASNCHIFALGSDTQESVEQWEEYAEEHREYAEILKNMAEELDK